MKQSASLTLIAVLAIHLISSSASHAAATFTEMGRTTQPIHMSDDGESFAYESSYRGIGDTVHWTTPDGSRHVVGPYLKLLAGSGQATVLTPQYPIAIVHWSATGIPQPWNDAPGTSRSTPIAISFDGSTVVGYAAAPGTEYRAIRGSVTEPLEDLGTLGGGSAWAHFVSHDGSVVVGHSETAAGHSHVFRWTRATGMVDLGTLGGDASAAVAISDDGDVVAGVSYDGLGRTRAFRWTPAGGMQDIGTVPGGESANVLAMNSLGSVVVGSFADADGIDRVFRWEQGVGPVRIELPETTELELVQLSKDCATLAGTYLRSDGERGLFRWHLVEGWRDLGPIRPDGEFTLSPDGEILAGRIRQPDYSTFETGLWLWSKQTGWHGLRPLLDALGAETSYFTSLTSLSALRHNSGVVRVAGHGRARGEVHFLGWHAQVPLPSGPIDTSPIVFTGAPHLINGKRYILNGELHPAGPTAERVGFDIGGTTIESETSPGSEKFQITLDASHSGGAHAAFAENASGRSTGMLREYFSVIQFPETLSWIDIGTPLVVGSQTFDHGSYNVTAGGADMWGTSDQFRFGYEPLAGDGYVLVYVNRISGGHPWARCGITFRSSLAPDAAHVSVFLSQGHGVDMQVRRSDGAVTERVPGANAAASPGVYLKLLREGDVFTASYGTDGKTWTILGATSLALPAEAHTGLFACAVSGTTPANAHAMGFTSRAFFGPDEILAFSGDLEFGDVPVGNVVERTVKVVNQSNATWSSYHSFAPTGFSLEFPQSVTLAPGEAITCTVRFAPATFGTHSGDVLLFPGDRYYGPSFGKARARGRGIPTAAPLEWSDIGSSTALGHESYRMDEQGWRIVAAGADMWGTQDQFRFGHAESEGDDALAVRIDSLDGPHPWSRAGLSFRSSLAPDSAHVSLVVSRSNGLDLHWRTTDGAETVRLSASLPVPASSLPVHLRLVRTANTFTGLWSTDGVAWQALGTVEVVMPSRIRAGIFACAVSTSDASTVHVSAFARGLDVPATPAPVMIEAPDAVYDGTPRAVVVTTVPAGLPVVVTYDGSSTPPTAAGTYTVDATIDAEWFSGSSSRSWTIARAPQAIEFTPIADTIFGTAPRTLTAAASSDLPVAFDLLSGPAQLVDNTLTITGAGTITVRAKQDGDANHLPATPVERSFVVAKATAPIVISQLAQTYTGSPRPAVVITTPEGLPVTVAYDGSAQPPIDAGSYTVVATIEHADYAGNATTTLVVSKAAQAISFAPVPDHAFGSAPVALVASADSGLPVSFAVVSGPASVAGGFVVASGAGVVTIRASQAGAVNHLPAAPVERSFVVTQAAATVAISDLDHVFDGSSAPVHVTTNPPGLNVVVSYDGSSRAPSAVGSYLVTATVVDADFSGSASAQLVIRALDPTGTYHGGFDPSPAGFGAAASNAGAWAIHVDTEAHATMLAILPGAHSVFIAQLHVAPDGAFDGVDLSSGLAVSGSVRDGEVSGVFASLGASFAGTLAAGGAGPGGNGSLGVAAIPHTADANLWALVAPDGHALVVVRGSDFVDGAEGACRPDGSIGLELLSGAWLEATLDPVTGALGGKLTPSGTELPVPIVGAAPGVPSHTRLSNLSSRGDVQDGDRIMIAGFVVAGEGTHRVLLRAVGPGLAGMVEAHAADTILRLVRSSDGTPVAANDDWHADATRIEEATTQVGALPLPEASKDAAMLIDLPAGSYTVLVDAVPGRGRVAIAEVYSVSHDASGDARLVNLSTRAVVGTGEEILIPGFVAAGDLPRRILLRAVGPTLRADLGDAALADPVLRVYTGESGRLVAENDDWHTSPTADIVREIADRVGAFALEADGRDAALVLTVPPNTGYTIHVSGKDGSTGIVLAEIYEVP